MTVRYLLDEHIPHFYRAQLLRREPELVVWLVGDPGAPPRGAADDVILQWCAFNGFLLVTGDRKSMPRHLADLLAAGRHVPGILILSPDSSIREVLDDLLLIAAAADVEEFRDSIVYLPLA